MKIINVEFTVAMNAEEKKAGNIRKVALQVNMPEVPKVVEDHAMANYKVALQSQFRNNWDAFLKGTYPKVVEFGQAIFSTRTRAVVRELTSEELAAKVIILPELARLSLLIDLMTKAGIEVPEEMLERELELKKVG